MATLTTVQQAVKQFAKKHGHPKAREVLETFGASSVGELPREKYDDAVAALTASGGAAITHAGVWAKWKKS